MKAASKRIIAKSSSVKKPSFLISSRSPTAPTPGLFDGPTANGRRQEINGIASGHGECQAMVNRPLEDRPFLAVLDVGVSVFIISGHKRML